MNKRCSKCKIYKDNSLFYKHKGRPDGFYSQCKQCAEAAKTQETRQRGALKFRYNITIEDYNEILLSQNNTCAICDATESGYKRKYFCVDHNHETNKIRGLLCYACNLGLGKFKDNIDTLKNAIKYLEKDK